MQMKLNIKSNVLKYVLILSSGTLLAQIVNYVLAPIISRIYVQEEYGELDLFVKIITFGATLASARYEMSIPKINGDVPAFRLYKFIFRIAFYLILFSIVFVSIYAFFIEDKSNVTFVLLIPLGILLIMFYNIGTNWAIRKKLFKHISYSKITNTFSSGLLKIFLGKLHFGFLGLIYSVIIGYLLSNFWFLKDYLLTNKKYKIKIKSTRNYLVAKENKEFPLINLPHTLIELAKELMIAFMIINFFTMSEFGSYAFTFRMLRLPLVLVGVSISQVFLQKCSENYNQGKEIKPILIKSVRTLILLSIIPFTVIFFFGQEIFIFVFSDTWSEAGEFAQIMAPWFMIKLLTSPISSLPIIINKQKEFFKIAIFGIIIMLLNFYIPTTFFQADFKTTLMIVSYTQALYLIFVIFALFNFLKKPLNKN